MATLVSRISDLAGSIRDKLNAMTPRLLPTGGTANMVLSKIDGSDFAVQWINVNDVVDYDRISTMIADAIANGSTDPGGGDDGGTDPGNGDDDGGDTGGTPTTGLVATRFTTLGDQTNYTATGDGLSPEPILEHYGPGTHSASNGNLLLGKDAFLGSQDYLPLPFAGSVPAVLRMSFKGVVPRPDNSTILSDMIDFGVGQITMGTRATGANIYFSYGNNGVSESVESDAVTYSPTTNHLYEIEWTNETSGAGGTVKFYLDGVQVGAAKPTTGKPAFTSTMDWEVNASNGNTGFSIGGLEVEYVEFGYQLS